MQEQGIRLHNPIGAFLLALALLTGLLWGLTTHPLGAPVAAQAERALADASIEVRQTVGTALGICAPTQAIAVLSGTPVYYCVTIRNNGTTTLTRHTLQYANNAPATITLTIPPGDVGAITSNLLNASPNPLSQAATNVPTHTITVTSTDTSGELAVGEATAYVEVGTASLQVVTTVGRTTDPAPCPTTTALAVPANTPVKYCITVRNTGTLPLIRHHLRVPLFGVDVPSFELDEPIPANQSLVITNSLSALGIAQRLIYTVTDEIANTAIFTAYTAHGVAATGQASAVALIGQTSTTLTDTLSADAAQCGTVTTLDITSGRPVYHCLRLRNTGTLTFTQHTIQWQQSSSSALLVNRTITETLPPGQSLLITTSKVAELGQANVTVGVTHIFTITSQSSTNVTAVARAQSRVNVGTQLLAVNKYATTERTGCVHAAPLNIIANQDFYYCLVLVNNGQVPLVRHAFGESSVINTSGAFTYTIAPGQRITLTNYFLTSTLGLPALLGPFRANSSFSGAMTVNAYSNANVPVSQSVGFQVNVTALTATPTTPPTGIPTFTPTITPTPTPSPTIPPTPTPSPVVVSFQPTPTQPFAINAVTTPTPAFIAGAAPVATDAFGQPISPLEMPTVDIASTVFALTVEAAATQTTMAFMQPVVLETPTFSLTDTPTVLSPLATSPLPTPTPLPIGVTPFATVDAMTGYLAITAQVFQVSTATLGWIWFAIGSVIFFATAGLFAGFSWHARRRRQQLLFEMAGTMEEENVLVAEPLPPARPEAFSPRRASAPDFYRTQSASTPPPAAQPPTTQPPTSSAPPDDEEYWPPSLR
ncbi:MAG: hypothetical protein KF832_30430 [Caldilineaceae bacterium]|nr:hypothetical protein [Caldilineaceae bacterium]